MNNELFERLLYEEENNTLDFKREQYRFARASDTEKSELLKDILGFANAWRRSEAYILIGVKEVRGGRGKVVGIPVTDHLDDHSLQQFVNNLTNQPIRFHYEAFGFEGKQIGIIRIEEQTPPVYLKKNYGKLKKEQVFVRRGSSTDPTKPASLEEIAQMRVGLGHHAAELLVKFAHLERDDALGTSSSWDAEFCKMPTEDKIPNLPRPQRSMFDIDRINLSNDYFFHELAKFEFVRRLFRPIRLVVENIGQVAANNVRVEITVPKHIGVMVSDVSNLPVPPNREIGMLDDVVLNGIKSALYNDPGDVDIVENEERFRIDIDCGDLQPGRRVWTEVFYVGKTESGDLSLCGFLFADNLPRPKDFELTASVTVIRTAMTVGKLCSLPEPIDYAV